MTPEETEDIDCEYTTDKENKLLKLLVKGKISNYITPAKVRYKCTNYFCNTNKMIPIDLQILPLELTICFPNIKVTPHELQFNTILIGNTTKTYITVYNLTGKFFN